MAVLAGTILLSSSFLYPHPFICTFSIFVLLTLIFSRACSISYRCGKIWESAALIFGEEFNIILTSAPPWVECQSSSGGGTNIVLLQFFIIFFVQAGSKGTKMSSFDKCKNFWVKWNFNHSWIFNHHFCKTPCQKFKSAWKSKAKTSIAEQKRAQSWKSFACSAGQALESDRSVKRSDLEPCGCGWWR